MRVLLVEDQSEMRMIVKRMLQGMGCFDTIDEATNGKVAHTRILGTENTKPYDLVICNVFMPVMTGIELLRRCRKSEHHRFIPFIMVCGSPQESTVAMTLGEWGANDFLVKPFSFELLQQRIVSLMRRVQSHEESIFRQAELLKQSDAIEDALKLIEEREAEIRFSLARWYNLKGECLARKGDMEEAIAQFEKAMDISEIYVAAFKNYATAHQKLGNNDKAIQALMHLEELSPNDPERTLLLGSLLIDGGDKDAARDYLENLVKRTGKEEKEAIRGKVGGLFLKGGLYKEAEALYLANLKANPGDLDTFNKLGIALRQQGKFEEAERCYMNALKIHPRHPGLYHNWGILHLARNDFSNARRCFQKALLFDPRSEETRALLNVLEENWKSKGKEATS